MRFRVLSPDEKYELRKKRLADEEAELSKWHRIFALWPRRLTSDQHEIHWLEFIYRKGKAYSDGEGGRCYQWIYAESELDILKLDDKDL